MSQVFEEFLKINDNSTSSNHPIENRNEPQLPTSPPAPINMYETIQMERLGSMIPPRPEEYSSGSSIASRPDRPFNDNIYSESLEVRPPTSPLQARTLMSRQSRNNIEREPSANLSCIIDSGNESDRTSVHSV